MWYVDYDDYFEIFIYAWYMCYKRFMHTQMSESLLCSVLNHKRSSSLSVVIVLGC